MTEHDEQTLKEFGIDLLLALAKGPIGAAILAVAKGESRLVIRQSPNQEGAVRMVIEVEPVLGSANANTPEKHPS